MRPHPTSTKGSAEPPLSSQDLTALREACGPVGLLHFPPIASILKLRRQGYVTIALGGVQITKEGLERLLRERERSRAERLHRISVG